MPIYGANQLVTQAVRAVERYEYHQPSHSQLFPPVVVAGPVFALIVPTVFGNEGVVLEGGLHPPAQHAVTAQPPEGRVTNAGGPREPLGGEAAGAFLLIFVSIGHLVWMQVRGIDGTTGTWRSFDRA
jgi:hypothetical protein